MNKIQAERKLKRREECSEALRNLRYELLKAIEHLLHLDKICMWLEYKLQKIFRKGA